jgi:PAS domain S-box-containing protein
MPSNNSIGRTFVQQLRFIIVLAPLVLAWLVQQGQEAGWYQQSAGLWLMALLLTIILLVLIRCNITIINQLDNNNERASERLQLALQGAEQGIWDWDLKTQVLTWDDGCKKIFGLPANFSVSYKWHIDALHPDDRQRVSDAATIALHSKTEFDEEYRTFQPDGTMRWVLARGRGYYDATGTPYRMSGIVLDITQRKEAEEKLLKSEAEFRTISNAAPALVWVCDAEGRNIYFNERWYEYTGQTKEEGSGYGWAETMHPEDMERILPYWQHCQKTGETYEGEVRYRRHDGEYHWHAFRALPRRDINGQIENWYGISFDISERKQAELDKQFLSELDLKLRQLNDAEAMVWEVVSRLGEYLNVDRCVWDEVNLTADLGITKQEWHREDVPNAVGVYRFSDFILPDIFAHYQAGQPTVVDDVTTYPYTALFANNYIPWGVRAFAGVPCINKGNLVAILSVNTKTIRNWRLSEVSLLQEIVARLWSVIEQTRASAALYESEERLRLALTAANQGWYDLNVQTGEAVVSPEYLQMLGYDPGFQETNAKWRERLHPDDWEPVSKIYEEYIAGKRDDYRVDFRQRTLSGEWKWILSLGKIITWDKDGKPLRMIGTHTDITKRRQAELKLIEANRLKDEFLAALSHELRTPLNPILGWTKLLQAQKLNPEKTKEALATIERNVKHQIALIDDLLDISSIIQGKFNLSLQPVDLAPILNNAIETVYFTAGAKSIIIQFHLPSHGVSVVMGDKTRLQQVFWNLLSNAIKFTPDGGRVDIWLEVQQNNVQIRITDTGIGICPKFIPHVFDRFRQADGSSTRKYGGLGLGLAIVKYLVELHGGTVEAESSGEAQGATFKVKLPLLK